MGRVVGLGDKILPILDCHDLVTYIEIIYPSASRKSLIFRIKYRHYWQKKVDIVDIPIAINKTIIDNNPWCRKLFRATDRLVDWIIVDFVAFLLGKINVCVLKNYSHFEFSL